MSSAEIEALTDQYLSRLKQIDRVLQGPVRWLIDEADGAIGRKEEFPRFHNWVSRVAPIDRQSSRIATSLAMVTLLRLNATRRRFPALKEGFERLGGTLATLGKGYKPERATPGDAQSDDQYFRTCWRLLSSDILGALNPLTATQVFRVLMEIGEGHAHSGLGCLAFFAMVWPLYRWNDEDRLDLGARIEPGRPSAYITAKCLLPLISLAKMCQRRAEVAERIVEHLGKARWAALNLRGSRYLEWRVCAELDEVAQCLREIGPISVASASFKAKANDLLIDLGLVASPEDVRRLYGKALLLLREALEELQDRNDELLSSARAVVALIRSEVVDYLLTAEPPLDVERRGGAPDDAVRLGQTLLFLHSAAYPDPDRQRKYIRILGAAAKKAMDLCSKILDEIEKVSALELPPVPTSPPHHYDNRKLHAAIKLFFNNLARVNREVARLVSSPVDLQARWCSGVANREVAYTSADNFTDFDPAELISSMAVAVRTDRFTMPRQLADAVKKAVLGAQPDGSWRLLHPYFSRDGAQGIRPPAADVVWTLASALSQFPEIDVADETLFRFVDWLERTQREIHPLSGEPSAQSDSPPVESPPDPALDSTLLPVTAPMKAVGWASDQMREGDRVNLLTTASAVNALLAIRDLVEHRLWELCRHRFTVVKETTTLFTMDPVDLIAPQALRLHTRLAAIGREMRTRGSKPSYSVVLHGPPGSSKTAVASALSERMWRDVRRWAPGESRLVRITPADFTRHGEERVESEAQLIFRLLGSVRGVTVLFDEIDDLLRRRGGERLSFLNLVVPAMLNRLQDLRELCHRQEICFLFGTNYVERIEPALMRQGRIDQTLPVTYPDHESRRCIVDRVFYAWRKGHEELLRKASPLVQREVRGLPDEIATETAGWPWSAISAASQSITAHLPGALNLPSEEDQLTSISDIVETELVAHSAQSQVDLGYEVRVRAQYDSQQLRHEYLYVQVSHWSPAKKKPLHAFLKQQIHAFGRGGSGDRRQQRIDSAADDEIRRKLYEDLKTFPHRAAPVWESLRQQ